MTFSRSEWSRPTVRQFYVAPSAADSHAVNPGRGPIDFHSACPPAPDALACLATSSCRSECDVRKVRTSLFVLQPRGHRAKRQFLRSRKCPITGGAVAHRAWQFEHFGNPATVLFQLDFNPEDHVPTTIPDLPRAMLRSAYYNLTTKDTRRRQTSYADAASLLCFVVLSLKDRLHFCDRQWRIGHMDDHMTIGAHRDQVVDWVDFIFLADGMQRHDVMYVNET